MSRRLASRPDSFVAGSGMIGYFALIVPRDWKTVVLLILLFLVELAGAVVIPPPGSVDGFWSYVVAMATGALLAPPTLLAIWAVYGPQRFAVRMLLTLCLSAAFQIALMEGRSLNEGAPCSNAFEFGAWLVVFVLLQLPHWLLRAVRNWRQQYHAAFGKYATILSTGEPSGTSATQFTLRGLLTSTLAIAMLLAAMRRQMSDIAVDAQDGSAILWVTAFSGLKVILAGLPLVPLAWIVSGTNIRAITRTVLSAVAITGLAGTAELLALLAENYPGFLWYSDRQDMQLIELGTVGNALMCLVVARSCGFRLHRPLECKLATSGPRASCDPLVALRGLSCWQFAIQLTPLLTAAAAITCVVPYRQRAWNQSAIAAEWWRKGVCVAFDGGGQALWAINYEGMALASDVLPRLLELRGLDDVSLTGKTISDRHLELMPPLASLHDLTLDNTVITDAGLIHLRKFPSLDHLDLRNTRISDAGLTHIKALPNLTWLALDLTDVTDQGLITLAEMPQLWHISATLTAVTECGASIFRSARPRINLEFGACDALLDGYLGRPSVLRSDDDQLQLTRLHARGKYVGFDSVVTLTDRGLTFLADQTALEELDVAGTDVTDHGLRSLQRLTALRRLDVRDTHVTEQGVARLSSALPNCEIIR